MTSWDAVQSFMRDKKIDGWLLYDFRGNNPILAQVLPGKRWTTRRAILHVPATGEPVLLVHGIDEHQFDSVTVKREKFLSWRDLQDWLKRCLAGAKNVAMEYVPGGALPVVSIIDAGTVEMVRSIGVNVVSSADLVQVCVAKWSPKAHEEHFRASKQVAAIKDEAFGLIRDRLAKGQPVDEYQVQQHIIGRFQAEDLEAAEPPIVAVNAHSGDPHFEPSAKNPSQIHKGDWVLIDLWARRPGLEHTFSDITWVGFAGKDVPAKHSEVFNVVKAARDAAVTLAKNAWTQRKALQGWELDEAARKEIIGAGYERFIRHRTGHSLSPGPAVHGLGVNIDNLETHDSREVLPGIGFTIEPGVYLPEFGVRLEINVYVDPQAGPTITSCIQDGIVALA